MSRILVFNVPAHGHVNPTLYVSPGTVFNANPEFFAAFADSEWQVVLSVGTRIDPSTLVRVPDNFRVRTCRS